ncbi:MAG TPA: metallophosphoesterase [Myxococcota bacterium]|nr:metallophosphoesterase [Myxococcota bacterium]
MLWILGVAQGVELVGPEDGAVDLPTEVVLEVAADAEVRFFGRGPWEPGEDFSIIVLPDTQFYACDCSGGESATFYAQTEWAVSVLETRNVKFVTHLGDCVEHGDDEMSEWDVVAAAYETIEASGVPFGVAVGNRDQSPYGDPDGTTVGYNQTFGIERFEGYSWYGGHRGDDNDNHYETFSGGGLDWIIVHVEYDQSSESELAAWVASVLEDHRDHAAIVVSHYLLNGSGQFSTQGELLDEALADYDVVAMLAGHYTAETHRSDDHGDHTVHTMLSDYQALDNGGDGWMRILTISPRDDTITVETWSPTRGEYQDDADSSFTLERALSAPWVDLGSSAVSVQWSGLEYATAYEWRVVEEDGTTSGPWTFTTAAEAQVEDSVGDSGRAQISTQPGCGCGSGGAGFWLLGALWLSARRRSPRR